MELKIKQEELQNSINIALKAVPNRTTLSILECIMITAENDEVRFTASDTELGIETFLPNAEIKEGGSLCVDAKTISAIVNKLPNGDVTLKSGENDTLTIRCGKSRFNIATKASDDFPSLDIVERKNGVTLEQETLKEIVRQTVFATSVSDNNRLMCGENIAIDGDKLKITALDGHRIAIREINLDKEYEPMSAVIPSKTLQEIIKLLSSGKIEIYFTDSMVSFHFDQTTVSSRLLEGEYFAVDKMITKDFSTTIKVDKQELYSCLDRAILLIKEMDRKPVIFTIGDTLKAEITTQLGSMDEEIEVEADGQTGWNIGINPRFINDVLRVLDEDKVSIYLNDSKSPCYINGDGYCFCILPVKF